MWAAFTKRFLKPQYRQEWLCSSSHLLSFILQNVTWNSYINTAKAKQSAHNAHVIYPRQRNQSSSYVSWDHEMLLKTSRPTRMIVHFKSFAVVYFTASSESVGLELKSTRLFKCLEEVWDPTHIFGSTTLSLNLMNVKVGEKLEIQTLRAKNKSPSNCFAHWIT